MDDFGASVNGVERLVPDARIDNSSHPSIDTVADWIAQAAFVVGGAIRGYGALAVTRPDLHRAVIEAARGLVEMQVAGMVQRVRFPEVTGDAAAPSTTWQALYRDGLADLAGRVTLELGELTPEHAGRTGDIPAAIFPPPAFYAYRDF